MRKLAVLFFGCARTYFKTYASFFEYIIDTNEKDGWEIDVFIHTWDLFEKSGYAWHKNEFPTLNNKKLKLKDIENIKEVYKPKRIVIDSLGDKHGAKFSKEKVVQLVTDYENENGMKYDYYLSTRMDILYMSPLKINTYIDLYENGKVAKLKLLERHTFVAFNPFVRMPVIDMRYINEGDIIYFSNFCFKEIRPECCPNNFIILINYRLFQDYFLQRENIAYGSNRTDILSRLLIQPQAPQEQIVEVIKEKPIPSIYLVAKDRIHNHLAYKLGQALIL
ncbi:MAG: hypothetical protein HDT10_07650, partial [Helicobacter sp.]|nr:hypothetical protein [Helicobacter sp.]